MPIFQDDFSGYPLGSHPNTWPGIPPWDIPPTTGTVVSADINYGSQQAFQEGFLQHTQAVLVGAPSVSHTFDILLGLGPNINSGIPLVAGQQGTGGYEVFGVGMNGDGTLFCRVCADPARHTTTYAGRTITGLQRNVYYNIIANCEFSVYLDISMNLLVAVQVNVAINGVQEIDKLVLTDAPSSAFTNGLGINRWVYSPGTVGGSTITNIVTNVGGGGIGPPPGSSEVRNYQGAIEVVYPTDNQANIYQGVIELVQSTVPPPTAIASCVMHS